MKTRRAALLVAIVVAMCAVVVIACSWRPLMAYWFYWQLRSNRSLAGDALGQDLHGWRQDGLRRYIESPEGGRLLCETLLREIGRGVQPRQSWGLIWFVGIHDGMVRTLDFRPYEKKQLTQKVLVVRGGFTVSRPGLALDPRLLALFKNAAMLQAELSVTDKEDDIIVTINAYSDPLIPEFVRADMRSWGVVQIRRVPPGSDAEKQFTPESINGGFRAFKRAMEERAMTPLAPPPGLREERP